MLLRVVGAPLIGELIGLERGGFPHARSRVPRISIANAGHRVPGRVDDTSYPRRDPTRMAQGHHDRQRLPR
jgi:hypothetical protein